jgi:hypothetical protein
MATEETPEQKRLWTGIRIASYAFIASVIAAVIAIPIRVHRDMSARTRVAEALDAAAPLQRRIEQSQVDRCGMKPEAQQLRTRNGVIDARVDALGAITLALPADIAADGRVVLRPSFSAGSVLWHCSAEGIQSGRLPGHCRSDGLELNPAKLPPPSSGGCAS